MIVFKDPLDRLDFQAGMVKMVVQACLVVMVSKVRRESQERETLKALRVSLVPRAQKVCLVCQVVKDSQVFLVSEDLR